LNINRKQGRLKRKRDNTLVYVWFTFFFFLIKLILPAYEKLTRWFTFETISFVLAVSVADNVRTIDDTILYEVLC